MNFGICEEISSADIVQIADIKERPPRRSSEVKVADKKVSWSLLIISIKSLVAISRLPCRIRSSN